MRTALIVFGLLGCQQELTPPPAPPPPPPTPPPLTHTPFLIHDLLVGEDGATVRKLAELTPYTVAVPDGPHRFIAGDFTVDTTTGAVTKRFPKAAIVDDKQLVRYEDDGKVRWTAPVSGARSVRPPDVAVGDGRTLVAIDGGVLAFDDATGRQVWTSRIAGDRLQIIATTAYSTMCNEPTKDHWLIATDLAGGAEKFRAPLPMGCDPWLDVEDPFVVVVEDHPAETRIFGHDGKLRLRLDEQTQGTRDAVFGKPLYAAGIEILVTDKHLIAIDQHAKLLWKRDHLRNTFVAGNQAVVLPDGDLVIANYGAIDDSGVDLVRMHPDGTQVWHSCATSLGVGHSEYEHFAYIEVRGEALFVASEGSYGAFLEKLAVATGERQLRCVPHADQQVAEGCSKPARACPQ